MVQGILITIGIVIVLAVVIISLQSSTFRIARSTAIAAPPAVVFSQVNDFHNWNGWSPWAKMDPAMKQTFEGPPAGVGAVYSWVGNKKVGEGRMTLTESRPDDLIRIKLEFFIPFKATNIAEFTFQPEGNQTAVTWAMTGHKNFMFKAVHLLMNMDKMVGGDFEKGLAQLKTSAEALASTPT